MKRVISMLLSFILAVCLLQGTVVSAASSGSGNAQPLTAEELPKIFESSSYWKMTEYNNQVPAKIVGEYYVWLATEMYDWVETVNVEGDDWRYKRSGWYYDPQKECLEINLLGGPGNTGVFLLDNGTLVSNGTYGKMVLTRAPDAKTKFERCRSSFEKQYGGINPAKYLVQPHDLHGYRNISDWNTVPYADFRNSVNNNIRGLVTKPSKSEKDALWQEISSLLGKNAPPVFQMDQVLFGVQLPEKDTKQMTYTSKANMINLVYTECVDHVLNALDDLTERGESLLSAPATYWSVSANDTYRGAFFWNDTEAACFLLYAKSLLILQGPMPEVKAMTEYMGLGSFIWKNGVPKSATNPSQKLQPGQTLSPTIEEMLGAKGLTMSDTFYALSDMDKYTFGYLAVKEEVNGDFVIVNICSIETQVQQIMYQHYFSVAGISEAQKSERKKDAQNQLEQFTHCAADKKTIAETDAFLSAQVLLDVLPQEYADLEEMGLLVLRDGQADIMKTMAHLEKNGWTIRAFQNYPYNELPVEYCWLMDRWGINVTQLDMCVPDHTIWALKELDTERPQQVMAVEDGGKIQFMAFRYFVPIEGLTEEQRSARIKTETDAARAALAELGESGEASFILFRHHACIVQLIRNVDDPSVQKFLMKTGMVDDAGAFTTAGLLESLSRDYLIVML